MAGTNDFKAFATGGGANVIDQATYAALTTIIANGFSSGVAESNKVNKVLRQAVFGSAVLGQIIADNNVNATDDGDVATFKTRLIAAIKASISGFSAANNNTFTKAQRGAIVALTDAATVAVDLALANNYSLTLAGNRTLGNPSNIVAGQSGIIAVTQDATGSRTLAYSSYYKFAGGVAPALSTTANAVDYLTYYVESATRIYIAKIPDIK